MWMGKGNESRCENVVKNLSKKKSGIKKSLNFAEWMNENLRLKNFFFINKKDL